MSVGNTHGSGPRGVLKVGMAGFMVLMLGLVLMLAGCGDSEQSSTNSRLDSEGSGASEGSTATTGDAAAGTGGTVMVDYTEDQCVTDLTNRYGSAETAQQVCDSLQQSYSGSASTELAAILPAVESNLGITPSNPAYVPGNSGGTTPDDTTPPEGSAGGSSGGGWGGIEVQVPQGPSQEP